MSGRGRPAKYTEADHERMRELHKQLGTVKAVAEAFGCSVIAVRCALYPQSRERRRESNRRHARLRHGQVSERHRAEPEIGDYKPLYDPRRDGGPVYADAQAQMFGDPPAGRREMIAKHIPTYVESDDEF